MKILFKGMPPFILGSVECLNMIKHIPCKHIIYLNVFTRWDLVKLRRNFLWCSKPFLIILGSSNSRILNKHQMINEGKRASKCHFSVWISKIQISVTSSMIYTLEHYQQRDEQSFGVHFPQFDKGGRGCEIVESSWRW